MNASLSLCFFNVCFRMQVGVCVFCHTAGSSASGKNIWMRKITCDPHNWCVTPSLWHVSESYSNCSGSWKKWHMIVGRKVWMRFLLYVKCFKKGQLTKYWKSLFVLQLKNTREIKDFLSQLWQTGTIWKAHNGTKFSTDWIKGFLLFKYLFMHLKIYYY